MRLDRRLLGAAILLALVATALGVSTLATRVEASPCLAPTTCGPDSPPVVCSNHQVYANICKANAACQYDCRPIIIAWP